MNYSINNALHLVICVKHKSIMSFSGINLINTKKERLFWFEYTMEGNSYIYVYFVYIYRQYRYHHVTYVLPLHSIDKLYDTLTT